MFGRADHPDPEGGRAQGHDHEQKRRKGSMRLHDVLDYQARERPTAEFAVQGNCRLTYREALREVHQLAHALVGEGIQIGDRVAILAKNRLESLLLYLAASKTGVVPVPLNYRMAPPEWAYILQDAQVRLLKRVLREPYWTGHQRRVAGT
jgi:acyl-CoA synthetase (AMP-forming)/AMP-acid ligase II